MLTFLKKDTSMDDFHDWKVNHQSHYQKTISLHRQNAIHQVVCTKLIYDVISSARFTHIKAWIWQSNRCEQHPAFVKLSQYWHNINGDDSTYEARIPYIQLFLNKHDYVPIIYPGSRMPIQIESQAMQEAIKESSILFGDHFLVTFLAGRKDLRHRPGHPYFMNYTVKGKPFLKERLLLGEGSMRLSSQLLKGLYDFPRRFPSLWQQLKKQHEVMYDDIH